MADVLGVECDMLITVSSTARVKIDSPQTVCLQQVFEATDEALKEEDAIKERLCNELNMLVQQSAHAQLEKLEQVRGCCLSKPDIVRMSASVYMPHLLTCHRISPTLLILQSFRWQVWPDSCPSGLAESCCKY